MRNKAKKIIRFYALDFTSRFDLEGKIYNFGVLFLRVVFSIETRPLRQQNQFLNYHENMSLVTEISAIFVIQFWCLGQAAEESGKFENVTARNNGINRRLILFLESSVYQFKHTMSKLTS